jgi:metallophosphoesterase (TIGR00282 family)
VNILVIGDVTSPAGIEHLSDNLWRIRRENNIDFCVVNGENASFVTGISPELAEQLFKAGADVISGGNHTLRNRAAFTYLDDTSGILRPINFGDIAPGRGYTVADACGYRILVINALGQVHMEPVLDSPFFYIDKVLREEAGRYDFSVLDIHAEATGEKLAVGYAYDGKINVVFGTHTHVQTADEKILPCGTGYISDVGMCGESGGVIGMDSEVVVERMRSKLPHKFKVAGGIPEANGVIFELDTKTKRVVSVKRITF